MQRRPRLALALVFALLPLAGCDDPSGSAPPAATATATIAAPATATVPPSATPAATATATLVPPAGVTGLAVLSANVAAGSEDALTPAPDTWREDPASAGFPLAFAHADWFLRGAEGRSGSTGDDGSFSIDGIAPGTYELELRKTLNGNLVTVTVPLSVGDDGSAEILIQIEQGRVRSSTTYASNGVQVREIAGPDQSRVVVADGRVVEVEDPGRHLVDPDGDGLYEVAGCATSQLWLCGATGSSCGDDRRCQCSASCPFCEDCGPAVCTPPLPFNPYRCGEDGTCSQPGDACTCVSSCPDCDDCALSLCVPSCEPATIEAVRIDGNPQVVAGRSGALRAIAELDSGGAMDVTYLATWSITDESVATVDAWGMVRGVAPGSAAITASFADVASVPFVVTVVERPVVTQVEVHLRDCIVPYGIPRDELESAPALPDQFFPYPVCRDVLRVGSSAHLVAFVTYSDGSLELATDSVAWAATPAAVARIDQGVLTALAAGTSSVTATVGGVTSAPRELRVVDRPTIVQLSIHADYSVGGPIFFRAFPDDPTIAARPIDCFDCGGTLVLLSGDERRFYATARFDTGEWEDVTGSVAWASSDPDVAPIDATGALTATAAGSTVVSASRGELTSNGIDVEVVTEATVTDLYIYLEGNDRVVGKGGEAYFRAQASYDVGFTRDVTDEAAWQSSNPAIGDFTAPGVFTGNAAGDVEVRAALGGKTSAPLPMGVFETSDVAHCDPNDINRARWSDAFNRVVLESDCREYVQPDVVELRFTVTERERPIGIFDPCLDLYVYQGDRKVRTIREEGCGEPFRAPGSQEMADEAPRFQLKAFWDLRDDAGNPVGPGVYTIHGRFYLYYDPVVSIDVGVTAPDGLIPCTPNDCGNGCGYVHACGGVEPPTICPDICTPVCECPPGWGITEAGGCEPCRLECCPPNARCTPDVPPCENQPRCCRDGEVCIDILPPCGIDGPKCCPAGETCLNLRPCERDCCPSGAVCFPGEFVCEEMPPSCVVTGCSGEICAAAGSEVDSTCEFLPEHVCYANAECAAQDDGSCGWTQTEELQRCLEGERRR